jgi:dTDP-4-amino-4,6-dideoxygalactose transaminase
MNDNIDKEDINSVINFLSGENIPKLTNGPKVIEFENAWGNWLGTKYNLFVNESRVFILVFGCESHSVHKRLPI